MKRMISAFLCLLMLGALLSGCSAGGAAQEDRMSGVEPRELSEAPVTIAGEKAVGPADFALRLFQASMDDGQNTLLSPISVLCALSMTANGAQGETLAQMDAVLGQSAGERNAYLNAYMDALPAGERYRLHMANALWLTEDKGFSVQPDFLQTNADHYGADIYQTAFDDETRQDINAWVKEKTDGRIENILDELSPEAVMYLVNALAFDAEWRELYSEAQVHDGVFTTEAGEARSVEMMHSEEELYLDDGQAVGFIKYYAGSQYAFVALLPNPGLSVQDYVQSLDGASLLALLEAPQQKTVRAALPKFESEGSLELSGILASMGMTDAFDERSADFSALGSAPGGNIFLSRVLHKCFIAVDERGTEAGAATVVEAVAAAELPIEEIREVTLDRPFVYMIIDCEARLPLFMGTLMDVGE